MNRRTQGKVKQARRRAQKRADIRAGRILSMQQYIHNTHAHAHEHEEEVPEEVYVADTVPVSDASHQLVRKSTGEVLESGTESQMRRRRTTMIALTGEEDYAVHKVKAA